jgi:hypothetical protein
MLDFKLLLKRRQIQISLRRKLITCDCTESEITLALYAYQARVEEAV